MKEKLILRIISMIVLIKLMSELEAQTNEQKNQLLLKDIKRNVVKGKYENKLDLVNVLDSNFDFLKEFNNVKFGGDSINNLPNKYLNKLFVSNTFYTNDMESKNIISHHMKVKKLLPDKIINKVFNIDSTNKTLDISNTIRVALSNKDSLQETGENSDFTNLFETVIKLPNFQNRIKTIIENNPEIISTDDKKEKILVNLKKNLKNKENSEKKHKKSKKKVKDLDSLVNEFNDELIKDNIALKKTKKIN